MSLDTKHFNHMLIFKVLLPLSNLENCFKNQCASNFFLCVFVCVYANVWKENLGEDHLGKYWLLDSGDY